jgi:flagellar biosynthesis regulator FlaF
VKRDNIFFKVLQGYFSYIKELVRKSEGNDRANAQRELIYAEKIWADFFNELNQGTMELPSELHVETWQISKFDEFKKQVDQMISQ